jgi:hypothetical protein
MSHRRRRLVVSTAIAVLVVATSACGRLSGNDSNPNQGDKRESAPAPNPVAPPVQAVASPTMSSTERAAANRAIGTRNGEHET